MRRFLPRAAVVVQGVDSGLDIARYAGTAVVKAAMARCGWIAKRSSRQAQAYVDVAPGGIGIGADDVSLFDQLPRLLVAQAGEADLQLDF